jgi:hypothetical protein
MYKLYLEAKQTSVKVKKNKHEKLLIATHLKMVS